MEYCPTNGKACFCSRSSAERAAKNMSDRHRGVATVYRCQFCNHWHLTHYSFEHSKAIRELNKQGYYAEPPKKKKKKDMRIFIDTHDNDGCVMVDTFKPAESDRKGILLAFTKEPSPIAVGLTYEQALELAEALKIQTARI